MTENENTMVVEIVVVVLDTTERYVIQEAIKHFVNSVDLEGETAKTRADFKEVVLNILRKVK